MRTSSTEELHLCLHVACTLWQLAHHGRTWPDENVALQMRHTHVDGGVSAVVRACFWAGPGSGRCLLAVLAAASCSDK